MHIIIQRAKSKQDVLDLEEEKIQTNVKMRHLLSLFYNFAMFKLLPAAWIQIGIDMSLNEKNKIITFHADAYENIF